MGRIERIFVCFVIAVVAILSFYSGHRFGEKSSSNIIQLDTIVVTETIVEEAPVADTIYLTRWERVPMEVVKRDTVSVVAPVFIRDTVYLPITTAYYERLDGRLRLWVNGYNASLERWELDEQVKLMPYRKKWGFSIGIGPAIIYSPFVRGIDSGVGIFGGVTYTF